MKINSVDNKTNFGWRYPTHKHVTALVVDSNPKLKQYSNILTDFVVRPDFDERGFKGNNHFYYPPQLFRPRESFMDITGKNNALARYEAHLFYFENFVNKDNKTAMEHAGRALHFLQDVTQPHHIQRGTVFQKWRDLDTHLSFEEYENRYHDFFLKHGQKVELDVEPNNFVDLFDESVTLSETVTPATAKNKELWGNIAMEGISNMVAVTKEFCRNISDALW